ncbi:unnamed protein product [Ectocarpus sp. 12 AP-2014]
MNWRLNEGRGECMYMLGYEDDGKATGMSPSDLSASIKTLRVMMEAVGAKIASMQANQGSWGEGKVQAGAGGGKLKVARVTVVRRTALFDGLPPDSERRGLRLGVLGHAGAGKSTLVSVLTKGMSDNGRGLARMQVFRHNHEVFNGQTSSISQQALTLPPAAAGSSQLGKTAPAALGRLSANVQGAATTPRQQSAVPADGDGLPAAVSGGGGSGSGSGSGSLGISPPSPHALSSSRVLSSSFPRVSNLEGVSASNGFASAWARKGNGHAGGGASGGGRPRGYSMDESGLGKRGLRKRLDGGGVGDEEEDGESRVLTFIDQPGHEKYLKTTLTGMTASALDYSMLVVSGVDGVQRMTREHLAIALALQLPIFVVMTKSDVAGSLPPGTLSSPSTTSTTTQEIPPSPAHGRPPRQPSADAAGESATKAAAATEIRAALQGIDRMLWACMGRRARIVGCVEDAEAAADAIRGGGGGGSGGGSSATGDVSWEASVPVMQVSSVTSDGIAELRAFLGRLSPPEPLEAMYKEARGKAAEVRISNTFMVEGVGEVYAGNVVSGTVSVGDRLLLGPTGPRGAFVRTAVASVHVARLD